MTDPALSLANDGADGVLANAPYHVGAVTLVVRDLDAVRTFYRDVIGLGVEAEAGDTVRLGTGGTTLVVLRADPDARPWTQQEAGLFHTAFLLPTRGDLGAWLLHADRNGVTLTGAADHLVSEAVYLSDPEGNGIEIYVDRPSQQWQRAQDGSVVMRNERLDRAGIVGAAIRPWAGMPAGSCVGHVHLQVGDLDATERFHADLLGFDVMCRYPGALFLGSGGYHHQLAGNIWNSRGAPVRFEGTTGLAEVSLIANGETLASVRRRCNVAGASLVEDGETLVLRDPWGTHLRLTSEH
ncbi:VOC family protein [Methylobacterium sp. SD274]|uniref:VOC family protein n=1 Tax=Methylobacterium sp. SD274 TaxID=2782009 RepID=UPI001A9757B4|nr:VOC family protein [Methylobacterium sp. SD274]MBO1021864.1 VOC family protein [Methylobacterium sp. SD274]